MLDYLELKVGQLAGLEREKTVFLVAVSPIEVHGPHLPVGTDIFIAEELINRYSRELEERYPDLTLIKLPAFGLGANALPVAGSINIRARVLEKIIFDLGKGLAEQGFRYLFLADNHGGPAHNLAIEAASRKLWKKYRMHLVAPFNLVFRQMVAVEPALLEMTGLEPGKIGDDPDNHAGTNETSLMLSFAPEKAAGYQEVLPAELPDWEGLNRVIGGLGGFFSRLGWKQMGRDFIHLANMLAWTGDPQMKPYVGAPGLASTAAGEAVLTARVEIAMDLFGRALEGEKVDTTPLLWKLRLLRYFV